MIRKLKLMWLFAKMTSWNPIPEWDQEDAMILKSFMNTMTGRKLTFKLQNQIISANERAAAKATPFESGWACGYRGLLAQFEYLSVVPPNVDTTENESDQADSILEQYNP